jgi:ribonucleoside-diphosphate reductase alpha chain|tara:strand:- start:5949 stop:7595 length:1647 start_codon:yes stop_codon:yes gene_type:complete
MMAFDWLNDDSRLFLSRGYIDGNMTAEERVRGIAQTAETILDKEGFADKFYDYMSRGFYSLSSPVWSNFGTKKGLPISCNGVFINDDMESILTKVAEVGMQTKMGAGTSGYFGALRPRGTPIKSGGTADGPVHFMNLTETTVDVVAQGNVRRGSFAAYLDVESPDIMEFLDAREEGSSIINLSLGVTISDEWMQDMIEGDNDKRTVWARILRKRRESGYPYLFFKDTVNNNKPQVLKDEGINIWASNLCSEICLPANEEESFVCNLASMNLLTADEWMETDAVETMIWFLDAVMEEYIEKTDGIKFMDSARNFAMKWRALGLGQLGWHSYLQSKSIPFESFEAHMTATKVSKFIDEKSLEASKELAIEYGEPVGMLGYGQRNLTRTAVAPTTSSSFILGQVSPSIEPLASNYFTKDLAKGKFTYRNPYLKTVLETYGRDDEDTWLTILKRGGSVQHLDFLTEHEKSVFKTFSEITPLVIVQQAAARQKYIDQAQSLNIMIHPDVSAKDVNALIIEGWKLGVKTFYYQRSANPAQELVRDIMNCASCEA